MLILLPQLLGSVLSEVLANVGLFLLMALGLNVVVGLAGMLDLGYVAFFAVGAYTVGVLTSPISPRFALEWNWWAALPVAILASAIAGLLVGLPVIRMRGDYLAIVTLGFGEIVRILFLSDWLSPTFGGAQGVLNIPGIPLGFTEVSGVGPEGVLYFALLFVILAAWISWSLQESRIGRAWMALREDETVAGAMGINIVRAKLNAFIVGAILAGFAGALFAAKLGSVFPSSFEFLVSIIILVVVIIGGDGEHPGCGPWRGGADRRTGWSPGARTASRVLGVQVADIWSPARFHDASQARRPSPECAPFQGTARGGPHPG